MKSKLIALSLFVATAVVVAFFPLHESIGAMLSSALPNTPGGPGSQTTPANQGSPELPVPHQQPQVEVVFVLDTTGSMGGLIETAKEKIWSIATTLASAAHAPKIKMGLVAYRDRGDQYVTQVTDLSSDLDSMYAKLMDFRAEGGGDTPESVNAALHDAVHSISWSANPQTYKVVFLVRDAPPHMDYQDDVKYPVTLQAAARRGIVVNAVQCGSMGQTTVRWEQIAALADGRFLRVEHAGGGVAIATPFDKRLANLSAKLDDTRLYYGDEDDQAKQKRKVAATKKLNEHASPAPLARRAEFNTSLSGEANLAGKGDLVSDVEEGRVDLSTVAPSRLPAAMRSMSATEKESLVKETKERRRTLKRQIQQLAGQRTSFLRDKVEQIGGAKDSLDVQIYEAVREQAAKRGLRYDAPAPKY